MKVRMAVMLAILVTRRKWQDRSLVTQNRTKQEVLYNWQLPQHLCAIHLDHPFVDLIPGLYLYRGLIIQVPMAGTRRAYG